MAALVISAAVIIMQAPGSVPFTARFSSGHPAARLRQTRGATHGTAGAGPRLLAMSADPPPAAALYRAADRLLLVLIAECIGRGLFYGLHMTVGMAVAG